MNNTFVSTRASYPGRPIYRYHLFYILEIYFFNLHTKFFLCRYLWDDCLRKTSKSVFVLLCCLICPLSLRPLQKSLWGLHDWFDLPWTGSPLMHFIVIRGFTFYTASNHLFFWYKDWGQESAFCTGQLRLQISRREHVFWIDIYGGGW